MAKDVIIKLKGIEDMLKTIKPHGIKVVKRVARLTPTKIIQNIESGRGGVDDRISLKKNAVSTINKKRSQGKSPKSLIDTGLLTSKGTWIVSRIKDGFKVTPNRSRRQIAAFLQQGIKGKRGVTKYTFMKFRDNALPSWIRIVVSGMIKNYFKKYA